MANLRAPPTPGPQSAHEVKLHLFIGLRWLRIPWLRDQLRKWLWRPLGRKRSECSEYDGGANGFYTRPKKAGPC